MSAWVADEAVKSLATVLATLDTPHDEAVNLALHVAGLIPGPALDLAAQNRLSGIAQRGSNRHRSMRHQCPVCGQTYR